MIFLVAALFSHYISNVNSQMNNEVIGVPGVTCMAHQMTLNFDTKDPFQGHVFVRGHYAYSGCRKDFELNRSTSGSMDIAFDRCGIRRQRKSNPKGLMMSTVLVVSFHRTFITQNDRAFQVDCFYMEEERIVTHTMEVSSLPTTETLDLSPPLPACKYSVLHDGPDGSQMVFANVGEPAYHVWSCESTVPGLYCMTVHSCTVDDGNGDLYQVVDEAGCARDQSILSDVEYLGALAAGAMSSVFKFADKAHVYFTCQIRLSFLHEQKDGLCPAPQCNTGSLLSNTLLDEPEGVRLRKKRRTDTSLRAPKNDFDLVAGPITVFELGERDDTVDVKEEQRQDVNEVFRKSDRRLVLQRVTAPKRAASRSQWKSRAAQTIASEASDVCLSPSTFGALAGTAVVCLLTALLCSVCLVLAFVKHYGRSLKHPI